MKKSDKAGIDPSSAAVVFEFLFLFWQVESLALQYIFTFISARQLLGLNALTLVVVGSQEVFGVWEKCTGLFDTRTIIFLRENKKTLKLLQRGALSFGVLHCCYY